MVPLSDVEGFSRNQNGWYDLTLKGMKKKLGISPEYAQNILATMAVIEEALKL